MAVKCGVIQKLFMLSTLPKSELASKENQDTRRSQIMATTAPLPAFLSILSKSWNPLALPAILGP